MLVIRFMTSALIAFVCVALIVPGGIYFAMHELPFMGRSFSQAGWAEAGDCRSLRDGECEQEWMRCKRGPMLRSLIRNHLFVGRTQRLDAEALLGASNSSKGLACVRYPLGYCSGLGVDMDYLELCFNEGGNLHSVRRFQG